MLMHKIFTVHTRLKSKVFSLERHWIWVPSPSKIGLSVVFKVGEVGID